VSSLPKAVSWKRTGRDLNPRSFGSRGKLIHMLLSYWRTLLQLQGNVQLKRGEIIPPLIRDLKICYKIIYNEIAILNDDFLCSRSLHILDDIITNYLRAVLGSIHTSISFRMVLLKSGMLCLVQW